jgi:hypothetical protein
VDRWNMVPDWDLVQSATAGAQPGLAARTLYRGLGAASRGSVRDPQTINEHWSAATRIEVSGVVADGGISKERSPLPGVLHRLVIDGQGPEGLLSGFLYVHVDDEGGYRESKQLSSRFRYQRTIDFDGKRSGIRRISWSASSADPVSEDR